MKKCPDCKERYEDWTDTCPECNVDLDMGKRHEKGLSGQELRLLRRNNLLHYITYLAMVLSIMTFPIVSILYLQNGKIGTGLLCLLFVYLFPESVLGILLYWAKSILRGNVSQLMNILFGWKIRRFMHTMNPSPPIFDWLLFIVGIVLVVDSFG